MIVKTARSSEPVSFQIGQSMRAEYEVSISRRSKVPKDTKSGDLTTEDQKQSHNSTPEHKHVSMVPKR